MATLSRKYEIGEPMTDEDSLAHYGTKGMKWGVRRGKNVEGNSRRGAITRRNDRDIKRFGDLKKTLNKGGGTRTQRVINTTNRLTMGRRKTERFYDSQIKAYSTQNERLKSGKLKVADRLDVALSTLAVGPGPRSNG